MKKNKHYVEVKRKEVQTALGSFKIETSRHARPYETKSYQEKLLVALGVTGVKNSDEAENLFNRMGLKVGYKRKGRSTVPVVEVIRQVGGITREGEGDYMTLPSRDWSLIAEYIEE